MLGCSGSSPEASVAGAGKKEEDRGERRQIVRVLYRRGFALTLRR